MLTSATNKRMRSFKKSVNLHYRCGVLGPQLTFLLIPVYECRAYEIVKWELEYIVIFFNIDRHRTWERFKRAGGM